MSEKLTACKDCKHGRVIRDVRTPLILMTCVSSDAPVDFISYSGSWGYSHALCVQVNHDGHCPHFAQKEADDVNC